MVAVDVDAVAVAAGVGGAAVGVGGGHDEEGGAVQEAAGRGVSRAYARSRTVVRQASRPEGSSPCWLQTSSTLVWRVPVADAHELERAVLLRRADAGRRRRGAAPVDGREEVLLLGLAGPAGAVRTPRSRCGAGLAWRRRGRGGDEGGGEGGGVTRVRVRIIWRCLRDAAGGARCLDAVERGASGALDAVPAVACAKAPGRRPEGTRRRRTGQVEGELRGTGRRVDEALVGARDDQREAVARPGRRGRWRPGRG